jgi:hypothetical protein
MNAMAGTVMSAATLFMKDADLDRNDLLGKIDLGAARSAMGVARSTAKVIMAASGEESRGPAKALRLVAALLASDTFACREDEMHLLDGLARKALGIPEGANSGPELRAFEDALIRATERFSGAGALSLSPHGTQIGRNRAAQSALLRRGCSSASRPIPPDAS